MGDSIYILPTIFRLMQGQTLSLNECQHDFFKQAISEGILIVDRKNGTIKEKKHNEERYYYTRERYGHTLLNYTCRFFDDNEDSLLMQYWEKLHGLQTTNRYDAPIIELNEKDENSIILLGKVRFLQESFWNGTKGTQLCIETKVSYTKLDGSLGEDWISSKCIIPEKECREVERLLPEKSKALIKGFFRPEKGEYVFFRDEEVNIIVREYAVIDCDGRTLESENGDNCFFINRSESDHGRYLNKVTLTGRVSNIGFQVTRGYPHITLHLRTRLNAGQEYLDIPVEIWQKHHPDCFKNISIGDSMKVEGYFKHPILKRYYYSYEPIDATVFAYKYITNYSNGH